MPVHQSIAVFFFVGGLNLFVVLLSLSYQSLAQSIAVDPSRGRIFIVGIFDNPDNTTFQGIMTMNFDGSNLQRFAKTDEEMQSITVVHEADRVCASDRKTDVIRCFDIKDGANERKVFEGTSADEIDRTFQIANDGFFLYWLSGRESAGRESALKINVYNLDGQKVRAAELMVQRNDISRYSTTCKFQLTLKTRVKSPLLISNNGTTRDDEVVTSDVPTRNLF